MGQGQGRENTPIKQERYSKILHQRMTMTKNSPGPFEVIDMNAGCGYNHHAGCPGSPLVAFSAADRAGRDCRFHLIEKCQASARELDGRIPAHWRDRTTVYPMDNRKALPRVLALLDHDGGAHLRCGLLYCDPNGFSVKRNKGVPLESLAVFAARARMIDLYFSLNAHAANRIRGCREKRPDMNMPDMEAIFGGVLALKAHRIVAPPPMIAGFAFMHVLLTNSPVGLDGWRDFLAPDDPRSDHVLRERRPIDLGDARQPDLPFRGYL